MEAAVAPIPQRSLVLVVKHLGCVDPQCEHHPAAEIHAEVALARHLEAKARLRGESRPRRALSAVEL